MIRWTAIILLCVAAYVEASAHPEHIAPILLLNGTCILFLLALPMLTKK